MITQSISNPNSSCVVGRRSRGSSLYFTHASRPGSTSTSRKPAEAVVIVERPTSVYSMAEYSFDDGHRASVYENAQEYEDENELGEEEEEEAEVLYVATAMKTTQHDRLLYRLGRPVLNFMCAVSLALYCSFRDDSLTTSFSLLYCLQSGRVIQRDARGSRLSRRRWIGVVVRSET